MHRWRAFALKADALRWHGHGWAISLGDAYPPLGVLENED